MRGHTQSPGWPWWVALIAVTCLCLFGGLSLAQESLKLPVALPSYNQAYQNGFGYWGDCQLGTDGCPDQIFSTGCLVAVFAAVLDYYGVDLFVPAASSCTGRARTGMDPGILNDWLRTHQGYGHCASDSVGNCCLEWTNLPSSISLAFYENRGEFSLDSVSQRIIDRALAQGHPVVAGVHWGSHCHGNTGKTEDCHWVVITGKLGTTYTIVDPYNLDATRQEGVRTTLRQGVFGRYVVDRFVVVSGSVPFTSASLNLALSFEPSGATFHKGDLQRRVLRISGDDSELLLFTRVIDPQGRIRYAYYPSSHPRPSDPLRTSQEKHSLYPEPRLFDGGKWEWNQTILTDVSAGTYTWEMWAEDPEHPGQPLGYDIASYTVVEGEIRFLSGGVAAVGLAVILTVFATALVYVLILTDSSK